jgi:hypothetical protein
MSSLHISKRLLRKRRNLFSDGSNRRLTNSWQPLRLTAAHSVWISSLSFAYLVVIKTRQCTISTCVVVQRSRTSKIKRLLRRHPRVTRFHLTILCYLWDLRRRLTLNRRVLTHQVPFRVSVCSHSSVGLGSLVKHAGCSSWIHVVLHLPDWLVFLLVELRVNGKFPKWLRNTRSHIRWSAAALSALLPWLHWVLIKFWSLLHWRSREVGGWGHGRTGH